jgi:hypothetical protein
MKKKKEKKRNAHDHGHGKKRHHETQMHHCPVATPATTSMRHDPACGLPLERCSLRNVLVRKVASNSLVKNDRGIGGVRLASHEIQLEQACVNPRLAKLGQPLHCGSKNHTVLR